MNIQVRIAILSVSSLCVSATSLAAEVPPRTEPARAAVPDTEPVKCYRIAWESEDKGGLGLTAGQAVRLCSGASDAMKVVLCYAQAWEHPANDGLGLTAGQAITLCKTNADVAAP
jgi:hypothetical protein